MHFLLKQIVYVYHKLKKQLLLTHLVSSKFDEFYRVLMKDKLIFHCISHKLAGKVSKIYSQFVFDVQKVKFVFNRDRN